ncbi:MAG TPA: tetratricopeptide repeat protein [Rhodanobacteraceae bacterium]|nr:tetratricopeptide repeat protein [Rhodanobacteraceae bacterium]
MTASALVARIVERLERGDASGAESQAKQLRDTFPEDAELARLHGIALLTLGRNPEARGAFERAIRLAPGNLEARSNLASALLAEGDADGAVSLLQQAVQARPGDPALHNNLANALRAAGDDAGARKAYLAALAVAPGHFSAIVNLAATELSLGLVAEAEARLRAVLAAQPHPRALLLLGHVLGRQHRFAEAQAAYAQAAQLAPNVAQFPYHAGLMADEQHHYGEAVQLYRRALQLDPDLTPAEGQLQFVLRRECEWETAETLGRRIKARALDGSGSVDPFAFLAEDATPAEQLACARARAARVVRDAHPPRQRLHFTQAQRAAGTPPRVGFLAAGFHAHATALLTVAMFEALGRRDDLELHLIATTPDDGSDVRRRLRAAAHAFHESAGQPATTIAQQVHDAGLDILVDVDGWCAGGMPGVFAFRPAPVQASWLAYPGTSGAPFIDYLIADRFVVPEALQRFYSEAIAYLPRCYQPSDTMRVPGAAPSRAAFGLPDDTVVFASFNNSWKLNAASFSRMGAVLREVPGSVLWLLDYGRDANARLREAARVRGLDPQRLVFSPALPHLQHLARYRLADLFLDTNPYNAHTTASDAIWAGCPVLTRPGETFASRVAGSLNHYLGMPELIARDDKTFIDTAVRYGNDPSVLTLLRERLAALRASSGLFDMDGYAQDFAALLHEMAERHRKGQPPQSIALLNSARNSRDELDG